MTPTLAERVLAGEPRAIARAISHIENDDHAASDLIAHIFERTGRAYLIGVTGPPGAGKSTLVDRLISVIRTQKPQSTQKIFLMFFSASSARSALIVGFVFSRFRGKDPTGSLRQHDPVGVPIERLPAHC